MTDERTRIIYLADSDDPSVSSIIMKEGKRRNDSFLIMLASMMKMRGESRIGLEYLSNYSKFGSHIEKNYEELLSLPDLQFEIIRKICSDIPFYLKKFPHSLNKLPYSKIHNICRSFKIDKVRLSRKLVELTPTKEEDSLAFKFVQCSTNEIDRLEEVSDKVGPIKYLDLHNQNFRDISPKYRGGLLQRMIDQLNSLLKNLEYLKVGYSELSQLSPERLTKIKQIYIGGFLKQGGVRFAFPPFRKIEYMEFQTLTLFNIFRSSNEVPAKHIIIDSDIYMSVVQFASIQPFLLDLLNDVESVNLTLTLNRKSKRVTITKDNPVTNYIRYTKEGIEWI